MLCSEFKRSAWNLDTALNLKALVRISMRWLEFKHSARNLKVLL